MKVVTLVDSIVAGGAERAAVEIACHLRPGTDSVLVSSRLDASAREHERFAATIRRAETAGVPFTALGRTGTFKLWEWRPLVRLLRRERPDVLHTHLYGSNAWGPSLARLSGVPVHVAHEHTAIARADRVRGWGRQEAVNRYMTGPFSDAILVPSAWSKAALVQHDGVPADKVHILPNGARSADDALRPRAQVRAGLGIPEDDEVVVVAAMLRPEKGHDVLLRAVAELRASHPHLRVLVLGAGIARNPAGTRPALEALARGLGIADRVAFLGHRHDVLDIVAASDVAALPSRFENLPLALLEYMESGTPIVATAVGGVPEVVRHRVHALLVPPSDPAALATAIRETLADPAAAARRAAAARARRLAEYEWPAIVRRLDALYVDLLAGRERRRRRR